jgi:hypothetical protein
MPASFSLPRADPYQAVPIPRRSLLLDAPREGNRVIPLSINWGNDSATLQAISFNLNNLTTLPITQLVAFYVNNLMSNVDVVFMFQDSDFMLTVPAQSEGLYPVDTNVLNFIARVPSGQVASNSDLVYFQAYNYMPPPVSVERAFVTSAAVAGGISMSTSNTTLIAAGTNGVLTGFTISQDGTESGAAAGEWVFQLQDGSGADLAVGSFGVPAATTFSPQSTILALTGLNIVFTNGITLIGVLTGTAFTAGKATANLYWR